MHGSRFVTACQHIPPHSFCTATLAAPLPPSPPLLLLLSALFTLCWSCRVYGADKRAFGPIWMQLERRKRAKEAADKITGGLNSPAGS